LSLYREGVKDLSFLVTTHTRKLAERAIKCQDIHLLFLCIQFLNTYLRSAISGEQTRTSYTVMNQYRLLTEFIVVHVSPTPSNDGYAKVDLPDANNPAPEKWKLRKFQKAKQQDDLAAELKNSQFPTHLSETTEQLEKILFKILEIYWPYYLKYCLKHKQNFVAETIAYDQINLLEVAFVCNLPCHDELLKKALKTKMKKMPKAKGILCARVKLATAYLVFGAENQAQEVVQNISLIPEKDVEDVCRHLESIEDKEFWEINDRLINFEYINSKQKECIPKFLEMFRTRRSPTSRSYVY